MACVVTVDPKLYAASRRKETFGFFLEYTTAYECRRMLVYGLDKFCHKPDTVVKNQSRDRHRSLLVAGSLGQQLSGLTLGSFMTLNGQME